MSEKCCPLCGGTNGYSYKRVEKFIVWSLWDRDESAESFEIDRETKPRCVDCGKIVELAYE